MPMKDVMWKKPKLDQENGSPDLLTYRKIDRTNKHLDGSVREKDGDTKELEVEGQEGIPVTIICRDSSHDAFLVVARSVSAGETLLDRSDNHR